MGSEWHHAGSFCCHAGNEHCHEAVEIFKLAQKLVFWEAAGMAGKSKSAATWIKLGAHTPKTTGTRMSSNGKASMLSLLNGNLDQASCRVPK